MTPDQERIILGGVEYPDTDEARWASITLEQSKVRATRREWQVARRISDGCRDVCARLSEVSDYLGRRFGLYMERDPDDPIAKAFKAGQDGINDMLQKGWPTGDSVEGDCVKFEMVSVGNIVQSALDKFQPGIRLKELEMGIDVQEDISDTKALARKTKEVVEAMIFSAIELSPQGDKVSIRVDTTSDDDLKDIRLLVTYPVTTGGLVRDEHGAEHSPLGLIEKGNQNSRVRELADLQRVASSTGARLTFDTDEQPSTSLIFRILVIEE